MIPVDENDFNDSQAERIIYETLERLSDDFYVFHSIPWAETHNRIGYRGEMDFLVFNPYYGFLAIEVKGGAIEYDNLYDNWYSTDRNQQRHKLARSPLQQAQKSCNHYDHLISNHPNNRIAQLRINPIVWFPDIESYSVLNGKISEDYQPAITLTGHNLQDPESALLNAFYVYGQTELSEFFNNSELRDIISIFSRSFRAAPSLAADLTARNNRFIRLTAEQNSLLDYLEDQPIAAIRGLGGTGKTLMAVELAKRLPKDDSILFLAFNNFILHQLRERYELELPNVEFANLHQLRMNALHLDSPNATPDEILEFLTEYFTFNYKHVIIDEAQDFEPDYLSYLEQLTRKVDGYFYVFYDEKQLVNSLSSEQEEKRTKIIEWCKNLDCRLVLHKNCRNTSEIASVAYAAIGEEETNNTKAVHGAVPNIINCAEDDQLAAIGDEIRKYLQMGFTRKQIVILTNRTTDKSILTDKTSIDGYRISTEPNTDAILFTTARKYKGCESDIVILVDINGQCFSKEAYRNVFYVGASRAKNYLSIIATLTDEEMLELAHSLNNNSSSTNGHKLLEDSLHVKIIDYTPSV